MIFKKIKDWKPPSEWIRIKTLETHTAGEPLRIILDGYPRLEGKTVLEKRAYLRENYDYLRKILMSEPRGHIDMYGALLVEPDSEDSDLGVIFMHNNGYSTGCGHAVIAIAKVLFKSKDFLKNNSKRTSIIMDVPSGKIKASPVIVNNKLVGISFVNVASFVYKLNYKIEIDGIGKINCDIAYGGAFYVVVRSSDFGLGCNPIYRDRLIDIGMKLKLAVNDSLELIHPLTNKKHSLYGTIFIDSAEFQDNHSRNVCVFANGQIDRSPTGTGVSARAAIEYSKRKIIKGEDLIIESIIGSTFKVSIFKEEKIGSLNIVFPKVTGDAYIIGSNTYYVDPDDPFGDGFLVK